MLYQLSYGPKSRCYSLKNIATRGLTADLLRTADKLIAQVVVQRGVADGD